MLPPGKGEYRFPRCGTGDKARDRMKQMADIRADFLRQQRDLQRDFSRGQISEDLYKKQTEALKTALAERPIFRRSITKTDEQQSDWRAGISDSLMNYADQASDLSSMAATATSEILDATTNSISNNLTNVLTGAASFKDGMSNIFLPGETVIKTLIQMATQALITKAIMASFGGGAGGWFGSLLAVPAVRQVVVPLFKARELIFHLTLSEAFTILRHFLPTAMVFTALPNILRLRKGQVYSARPGRKPSCPLPVALMVRWGSELLGGNLRRYRTLRSRSVHSHELLSA